MAYKAPWEETPSANAGSFPQFVDRSATNDVVTPTNSIPDTPEMKAYIAKHGVTPEQQKLFDELPPAPGERAQMASEPIAPTSFATDVKDVLSAGMSGASSIPNVIGQASDMLGFESTGKFFKDVGQTTSDYWDKKISEEGQRTQQEGVLNKDGTKADLFSQTPIKSIFMSGAQSVPGMIGMIPLGGPLAAAGKALGVGGKVALGLQKSGISGRIARRLGHLAPSAIGYGSAEGMYSGLENAHQAGKEVEGMSNEQKIKSPFYNNLLAKYDGDSVKATDELKKEVELKTFLRTAPVTAGIGMLTGGGVMGKLSRKNTGGVLKNLMEGARSEGIQETFQSGGEQIAGNTVTQDYVNPDQNLMEGVGEAMVAGGAAGALLGAAGGAAGGVGTNADRTIGRSEQAAPNPIVDAQYGSIDGAYPVGPQQTELTMSPQEILDEQIANEMERIQAFEPYNPINAGVDQSTVSPGIRRADGTMSELDTNREAQNRFDESGGIMVGGDSNIEADFMKQWEQDTADLEQSEESRGFNDMARASEEYNKLKNKTGKTQAELDFVNAYNQYDPAVPESKDNIVAGLENIKQTKETTNKEQPVDESLTVEQNAKQVDGNTYANKATGEMFDIPETITGKERGRYIKAKLLGLTDEQAVSASTEMSTSKPNTTKPTTEETVKVEKGKELETGQAQAKEEKGTEAVAGEGVKKGDVTFDPIGLITATNDKERAKALGMTEEEYIADTKQRTDKLDGQIAEQKKRISNINKRMAEAKKEISDAKAEIEDWSSREYKKTNVSYRGKDMYGQDTGNRSVSGANERRRQGRIQGFNDAIRRQQELIDEYNGLLDKANKDVSTLEQEKSFLTDDSKKTDADDMLNFLLDNANHPQKTPDTATNQSKTTKPEPVTAKTGKIDGVEKVKGKTENVDNVENKTVNKQSVVDNKTDKVDNVSVKVDNKPTTKTTSQKTITRKDGKGFAKPAGVKGAAKRAGLKDGEFSVKKGDDGLYVGVVGKVEKVGTDVVNNNSVIDSGESVIEGNKFIHVIDDKRSVQNRRATNKNSVLEAIAIARNDIFPSEPMDGYSEGSNPSDIRFEKQHSEDGSEIINMPGSLRLRRKRYGDNSWTMQRLKRKKNGRSSWVREIEQDFTSLRDMKKFASYYVLGKANPIGVHIFKNNNMDYEFSIPNSEMHLDVFEAKIRRASNVKFSKTKTNPNQKTNPNAPKNPANIKEELSVHKKVGKRVLNSLLRNGTVKIIKPEDISKVLRGAGAKFMTAWHGTPHDVDRFKSDKIGTGEGAQAYGYGLYFADSKEVAEWYKKELTNYGGRVEFFDKEGNSLLGGASGLSEYAKKLVAEYEASFGYRGISNADALADSLLREASAARRYAASGDSVASNLSFANKAEEFARAIAGGKIKKNKGNLYKVELAPKEEEYLRWDKPLSEQSEFVKERLKKIPVKQSDRVYGNAMYGSLVSEAFSKGDKWAMDAAKDMGYDPYSAEFGAKAAEQLASEYLHSLGIRGIKYADGATRNKQGKKDFNYVIFDENDITIEARYSKSGVIEAFTMPDGTIYLVDGNIEKGEAYSTLLHEAGHAHLGKTFTGKAWAQLKKVFDRHAGKDTETGRAVDAARKLVPEETIPEHRTEEGMMYFISETANQELTLYKRIMGHIRRGLVKLGFPKTILHPDDIVAMAEGYLAKAGNKKSIKLSNQDKTPKFSKSLTQKVSKQLYEDQVSVAEAVPKRSDLRSFESVIVTPDYTMRKDPAAKKAFEAGQERNDNKVKYENEILDGITEETSADEYSLKHGAFVRGMQKMQKEAPKIYEKMKDYLLQTDATGDAFKIRTKGEEHTVYDPNGKAVGTYDTAKRAEAAMMLHEAAMLKELHMPKKAIEGVMEVRKVLNRGFDNMVSDWENIVKYESENDLEPTMIPVVDEKRSTDKKTVMKKITLTEAIAMMGDLRGSYFPRQRPSGGVVLKATKDGRKLREHFDMYITGNKNEKPATKFVRSLFNRATGYVPFVNTLEKRAKQLKREGWDITEIADNQQTPESVFEAAQLMASMNALLNEATDKKTDDVALQEAYNHLNKVMVQNIADIFKARGGLSSRMKRAKTYTEGFETDPLKAVTQYAKSMSATRAKREAAQKITLAITGRDKSWNDWKKENKEGTYEEYREYVLSKALNPKEQPNLHKEVMSWVKHVLKNDEQIDRVIGTMKGLAVQKFLGFRVSSAAVNMTNLFQAVPPTISNQTGVSIKDAFKQVTSSLGVLHKYSKGEASKLDTKIITDIKERGWDNPQFNHESAAVLRSKMGNQWAKFIDASMAMFGWAEKINRGATIHAAYKSLKSNPKNDSMSHDDLMKKAHEISNDAHGVYGKETAPVWTRGTGNPLKAGYTFKKFSHNYLLNMGKMIGDGDYKNAMYMLLSPGVIAGAGASAATPAIAMLASIMGAGDDPEEKFYEWAEGKFGDYIANDVLRHGVGGAVGVNLGGSLQMNMPFPTSTKEVFGAPLSVGEDMVKGAQHLAKGETLKGAERLLPAGFGNIIKAAREYSEGVTTGSYGSVYYGDAPLKASVSDAFLRGLSFNPSNLSAKRERQWSERKIATKYQQKKTEINSRIKRMLIQYGGIDGETWGGILADIHKLNEVITGLGRNDISTINPVKSLKRMNRSVNRPNKRERNR